MPVTEQIPEVFGRYRIVKPLGSGAMGSVYLARDTQLDREVALKVPQFKEGREPQILARFYQEARAAATVHHPNVCPVFDVGEIDGIPYLTMAYIEGKPLAQWVSSGKPLNERQIATIGRKVAEALYEAHKKGVIHRDLKPANIMINKRGEPIVMDFGLAHRAREDDTRLTRMGAVLGSPAYMSPEQVKGETESPGPGTDVFSLGVILYELIARRLPFPGPSLGALHAQILMEEPPPLREICPDLSPTMEEICMKALEKKVEDRHKSMAHMAVAIKNFLNSTFTNSNLTPLETRPAPVSSAPTNSGIRGSALGRRSVVLAEQLEEEEPREQPRRKKKRKKVTGPKIPSWVLFLGIGGFAVAALVGFAVVMRPLGPRADITTAPSADKADGSNRNSPNDSNNGKEVRPSKEKEPLPKKEPEFRALFNGTDYKADWEAGPGTLPNAWRVENGSLISVGTDPSKPVRSTLLLTRREYSDFDLRLDFKLATGGLSGVVPRVVAGQDIQIGIPVMHDSFTMFRKLSDPTQTLYTGALRFVGIDKHAALNPVDQWNSMSVRVQWPRITVLVNGQETVIASLDSNKIPVVLGKPLPRSGKIGLINNIGTVHYRNILIQEPSDSPDTGKGNN
jgi:serine/threonine protein kinase